MANELVSFEVEDKKLGYKARGYVSNANYNMKKTTLLLFINHRSVESQHIKKSLEQVYAAILPKGGHPFAYLSLEIEPQRVDVNVHPTKRHVNFLNEDEIIEQITGAIGEKLASIDTSRTFLTQTLLPGAGKTPARKAGGEEGGSSSTYRPPPTPSRSAQAPRKVYENNLNRVDPQSQKITALFKATATTDASQLDEPQDAYATEETPNVEWTPINYRSIRKLRQEVTDNMHNELYEIFHNHTFVGIVDESRRFAAVQHGVKLYLVNYGALAYSLFYQIGISDFANFGKICFRTPLDIRTLLNIAITEEKKRTPPAESSTFDWANALETSFNLLIDKRDMLNEYFCLDITPDGKLLSIPLLIKSYVPNMGKLPSFLLSLGPSVDWTQEYGCFKGLITEVARFYTPERVPLNDERLGDVERKRRKEVLNAVEGVIMPAVKKRLVPGQEMLKEVQEVANLKGLYRIFERC